MIPRCSPSTLRGVHPLIIIIVSIILLSIMVNRPLCGLTSNFIATSMMPRKLNNDAMGNHFMKHMKEKYPERFVDGEYITPARSPPPVQQTSYLVNDVAVRRNAIHQRLAPIERPPSPPSTDLKKPPRTLSKPLVRYDKTKPLQDILDSEDNFRNAIIDSPQTRLFLQKRQQNQNQLWYKMGPEDIRMQTILKRTQEDPATRKESFYKWHTQPKTNEQPKSFKEYLREVDLIYQ